MSLKLISTTIIATAVAFGVCDHYRAIAQQAATQPLQFNSSSNELYTGSFHVSGSRFADPPGRARVLDGNVTIHIDHSNPALIVESTKDGLEFGTKGKAGTPSAFTPIATMPFDKSSLSVKIDEGITTLSDASGRTVTIYGYGTKPNQ